MGHCRGARALSPTRFIDFPTCAVIYSSIRIFVSAQASFFCIRGALKRFARFYDCNQCHKCVQSMAVLLWVLTFCYLQLEAKICVKVDFLFTGRAIHIECLSSIIINIKQVHTHFGKF